ncbi:winged helix-turn-helix transcriptional regulator [Kitasatospora cathayae]|uniref:Helix-turn-helix domain-containing protein n=1 Tax=Kitasatospora cathayae TaxID=3004092 RepID=A0ABY7QCU7_9ACTN|nr:helix-turn-helix domain-containing protein [Kitasatospora sp. HUAS 3-15]WBP90548.1 helix-turn-helix domain-containing protein [Kitasatospora sp. HUAS 3-15]
MSVGHTAVTTPRPVVWCDEGVDCGIRDLLNRLGDRWSVLAVVELAQGVRRFRELQRALPGISQRMLTLTVRRLERDGLVSRTVHPTVPPQVEYELTPLGHSLTHLVRAMVDWSYDHHDAIVTSRQEWDEANPGSEIR